MLTETIEKLAFASFPKIARLSRDMVITEKMDGTNAQIVIGKSGEFMTCSRNRIITPEDDNFGFSRWAHEHKDELMQLGPGRHFGEWWGQGIQRGYGLAEKRFSLFNVNRFTENRPACCHVVPVLMRGPFDTSMIQVVMDCLGEFGSVAAPGFMLPEGIIVFHTASSTLYKKTFEGDEGGKGQ